MQTLDELIAEEEADDAAGVNGPAAGTDATVRTVAPKNAKELREKIKAGTYPLPGGLRTAWEALQESNRAAGQSLADQTLMGVPGRALRAAGQFGEPPQPIPEAGKVKRGEDYLPTEQTLTSVPAAAIDVATMGGAGSKAGETLGAIPGQVARRLGASEAQTAVRPGLQAATNAGGAGTVFGGTDAALRGGDLEDIGSGMITGAAGNVLMSQVPAIAGSVEEAARNAAMSRAVRPLLATGQGKAANKMQLALGKGDKAAGKAEAKRVVEQEGLEPTIRKNPSDLANVVQEKLDEIGAKELGPIRALAYEAEPGARVPVARIKEKLRGLLTEEKKGTDFHDDVELAIKTLEERSGKAGSQGQFPLRPLLKNAQEFERDGYGKTEAKFRDGESARAIGSTLRGLVDERISKIYQKRPELVKQALGLSPTVAEPRYLETGAENPDYVPPPRPGQRRAVAQGLDPEATGETLNLSALGDRYAAARKRYADLKAVEPAAEQLSSRMSQERSPGLINAVATSGKRLLGGVVGGSVGGAPGAILGAAGMDIAGRLASPVQRTAGGAARIVGTGPAVDPRLTGAIPGALLDDVVQEEARKRAQKR